MGGSSELDRWEAENFPEVLLYGQSLSCPWKRLSCPQNQRRVSQVRMEPLFSQPARLLLARLGKPHKAIPSDVFSEIRLGPPFLSSRNIERGYDSLLIHALTASPRAVVCWSAEQLCLADPEMLISLRSQDWCGKSLGWERSAW